jgi:glycosyltransferase involved in cell wall biosynthesis
MTEGLASERRCVLVVGGSHSVHVRVPAQMLRAAGYRVVLADLLPKTAPGVEEAFDASYSLMDGLQRLAIRGRTALPAAVESHEFKPVEIETTTRWRPYLWRLFQSGRRAGRLLEIVRREHPGVLHFQSITAGGMAAYYLLKRLGWPAPDRRPGLLTHLWGYAARFPGIRRREIRVLREFDHIHTSSPAVGRIYREHFEVPPQRLSVFVRGIRLETFAPRPPEVLDAARREWGVPADKFVIIHNRHLHRMYRVDVAVDAFIALAQEGHDVFLMLVRGSMCQPDYEQELLARLAAHGLAQRVALMPPVLTPEQMATALQLAHCSVNCVPFDAFPVSILEALYCRAVPVVRNLESYTQFVKPGQTAFAVDGGVEDYVAAIRRLITEPGLRERLADAGVALVAAEGSEEIFRQNTLQLIAKCWHEW